MHSNRARCPRPPARGVAVLGSIVLVLGAATVVPGGARGATAAQPDAQCTSSYGGEAPVPGGPVRFGIDPELAGAAGPTQLPAKPEDPARKYALLAALRPPGRELVVRVNRLFSSDGEAGVRRFQGIVSSYTSRGFAVEVQVRYHPAQQDVGNIPGWVAYVRHVVDVLGADPRVVAMTITNEVNLTASSNTSDGAYRGARDALIAGIVGAQDEAHRRGYDQLRFGFTYAYRGDPSSDADFWSYLGTHGGPAFRAALGWVGLDFYPGSFYPPVVGPGDSYRAETANALGTLRRCYMVKGRLGPQVPLWVTENGIPTTSAPASAQAQLAALGEIVGAVHDYGKTYGVTDYRYFNLRDNDSSGADGLFSTDGLLYDDYTPKPSFGGYRDLIGELGAAPAVGALSPGARSGAAPGPRGAYGPCAKKLRVHLGPGRRNGRALSVRIYVNGHLVARAHAGRRRLRTVVLSAVPGPSFHLRIVSVTARGLRVTTTRPYRGCLAGRRHTVVRRVHARTPPRRARRR